MDPQKLVLVDKRIVQAIRSMAFLLSVLVAAFIMLIYFGIFVPEESFYPVACIPIAAAFMAVGAAVLFWNPYTLRKVLWYSYTYLLVGTAAGFLVIGFSDITFMCWLVLIVTIGIYFNMAGAALAYGAMLFSLTSWIWVHPDLHNFESIATLLGTAFVVGLGTYIMLNIWRLTVETIENLDKSRAKEDLGHQEFTSLINSMADGVIAVDEYVNVVLYNAAALNILDLNSSMQGVPLSTFLKPVTQENATIDIVNFVQNTRTATVNRDLRIQYSDKSFANLYLSVAPVHLGYGKEGAQGFVLIIRDITREKSLEEERDEFISVVSHELRTPIAISEGNVSNAQYIADKGDDPAIKQALNEAHSQIMFLADMINDLATLSRAERGKLTLELEDIVVPAFVDELVKAYTADAEKKHLQLSGSTDPSVATLRSGKLYVREILQNFVTNAIKYTESGSVSISAEPHEGGVVFKVSDTGIGISKADQERVFDKFFRSEDFRTRQNNGTGLGLYVTMKLTRLIHADISLESELNKGSVFSIFIPNLQDGATSQKSAASETQIETAVQA